MKLYQLSGLFILTVLLSCRVHQSAHHTKGSATSIQAKFLEAENARLLGNNQQARGLYEAFVHSYPDNGTAWYNLGQLYLQQLEIKRAERAFEKACTLSPDNKYFRELYAAVLMISKKNAQAVRQYDLLIAGNPKEDDYLYEKAMMHERAGEYEQAMLMLDQLEKQIGFSEELIDIKRKIYLKQGKTDLAVAEVEKLKQADRSSPRYDRMIADIYEDAKQQEKADGVYKRIETEYPNDPMAQMMLAQYYAQRKDTVNYNRFMQRIMKNNNLDIHTKMALVLPALKKMETDTGQRDEFIELVRTIRNEAPANKDAISLFASVLYIAERYDEALAEYRHALSIDQQDIEAWTQMISIYSDKGNWKDVIKTGKEATHFFPANAILYFYTGMGHLRNRQPDSSIDYFQKALALEKDLNMKAQCHALMGEAWHALGDYTRSDTAYLEAIRIQPSDAMTLNNYAYYLSIRGERLDEAEKMSKKSLQILPGTTSFLDTYGWILYRQGKYSEAQTYIRKAIEAGGEEDGTLYEHLGDVYEKLGDKVKAREYWKKANEKGEDSPQLRKKIQDGE